MKSMKSWQPTQLSKAIKKRLAKENKKHLLITGERGAGKTTLLMEMLKEEHAYGGILTTAVGRMDDVPTSVVLYDIQNPSEKTTIGVRNQQGTGMCCVLGGFETVGVEILKRCEEIDHGLIVIDEIGFLEKEAYEYQRAILNCFEKQRVWAVLKKQTAFFIQKVKRQKDVLVIDLDRIDET